MMCLLYTLKKENAVVFVWPRSVRLMQVLLHERGNPLLHSSSTIATDDDSQFDSRTIQLPEDETWVEV